MTSFESVGVISSLLGPCSCPREHGGRDHTDDLSVSLAERPQFGLLALVLHPRLYDPLAFGPQRIVRMSFSGILRCPVRAAPA